MNTETVPSDTTFSHYQLLIGDARALGDRRETVNNLYVGLITLILGAEGYLFIYIKNSEVSGVVLSAVVGVFGIVLSFVWRQVLSNYKKLLDLRYKVLIEWERAFPEDKRYYSREDALYYSIPQKARRIAFVKTYILLPNIMIVGFLAIIAVRFVLFFTPL
jgi:hypothetical protein